MKIRSKWQQESYDKYLIDQQNLWEEACKQLGYYTVEYIVIKLREKYKNLYSEYRKSQRNWPI